MLARASSRVRRGSVASFSYAPCDHRYSQSARSLLQPASPPPSGFSALCLCSPLTMAAQGFCLTCLSLGSLLPWPSTHLECSSSHPYSASGVNSAPSPELTFCAHKPSWLFVLGSLSCQYVPTSNYSTMALHLVSTCHGPSIAGSTVLASLISSQKA